MAYVRGDVFAGYTIERELGSGGMGSVYLARHPTLPRWVALKTMKASISADPQFRSRFEREADVAADLFHRNIVTVLDRGTYEGQLWIAMQYVAGIDAAQALSRAGGSGLGAARAVHIVQDICAGLDMVHHQGMLHRDLKPANILLAPARNPADPETALLADFGIAKPLDAVQGLTSTHAVIATFAYAAPEVLEGRVIDRRADIYALGCVLFELLTGRVPFPSATVEGYISAHLVKPPPRPSSLRPDLPIGLDAVVARAMAKVPGDRFDDCREFAAAAVAALSSPPARTVIGYIEPAPTPVQPPTLPDELTDPTWVAGDRQLPTTATPAGQPFGERRPIGVPMPAGQQSGERRPIGVSMPAGQQTSSGPPPHSRPRRRWLAALVVVAVLVAGGVYFAVNQLTDPDSGTAQPSGTGTSRSVTSSAPGSNADESNDGSPGSDESAGSVGGAQATESPSNCSFGTVTVPPPTTLLDTSLAGESSIMAHAAAGALTIGIKFDQPGLGLKNPDGRFSGFDVEIARIVARSLGVAESGITFIETPSKDRERAIESGEVDFVVATYSISETRKEVVSFAGPYFTAHQDLLVRASEVDICSPYDLDGKRLCSVSGSTSATRVQDSFSSDVDLKEFGTYAECVVALEAGVVDAVTTDDIILAGLAAQNPGKFKLLGTWFSDESYGIGIAKGDAVAQAAINAALQTSFTDGSWKEALDVSVGASGFAIPEPPTIG